MNEYRATTPLSVFFQAQVATWCPEQVASVPTSHSSSPSTALVLGQLLVGTGEALVAVQTVGDGKSQTGYPKTVEQTLPPKQLLIAY